MTSVFTGWWSWLVATWTVALFALSVQVVVLPRGRRDWG